MKQELPSGRTCIGLTSLVATLACSVREPAIEGPRIECVGRVEVPGDARDRSGLTATLEDGSPADLLGGFGSAVAWTGSGSRFVGAVDRGPADGATTFTNRLQWFDLRVDLGVDRSAATRVTFELVATTMLVDEEGRAFTGDAGAFDVERPERGSRLDPEGLRVSPTGSLFLSDEYGPSLMEFSPEGRLVRRFAVPPHVRIARPARTKEQDLPENVRGRVTNHGFEGLALAPDGGRLFTLLQHPLIQDGGRKGRHCRLFEFEIASGAVREFVASLDDDDHVFNEILAIDRHRFLAIERDDEVGERARVKRIVELDLREATDVTAFDSLGKKELPAGVVAAKKRTVIDLLDPRHGLVGANFPEKVEGLCFGPDLPDGRRMLVVASDNDLKRSVATHLWVFAVADTALGGDSRRPFEAPR